jgi:hypothetical protein
VIVKGFPLEKGVTKIQFPITQNMCLKFSWLRQNKVLDWIIKSGFGVQSLITPKGGIFGMRF